MKRSFRCHSSFLFLLPIGLLLNPILNYSVALAECKAIPLHAKEKYLGCKVTLTPPEGNDSHLYDSSFPESTCDALCANFNDLRDCLNSQTDAMKLLQLLSGPKHTECQDARAPKTSNLLPTEPEILSLVEWISKAQSPLKTLLGAIQSDNSFHDPLPLIQFRRKNGQTFHLEFISKGGYGGVFKISSDTEGKAPFALKILRTDQKSKEVEIMKLLQGKSVDTPRFYFSGPVGNGLNFIAMELIPAETLFSLLATGSLSAEDKAHLKQRLPELLTELHKLGICHRDLKLKNILYDPKNKKVTLIDFGEAEFLDPANPAEKIKADHEMLGRVLESL